MKSPSVEWDVEWGWDWKSWLFGFRWDRICDGGVNVVIDIGPLTADVDVWRVS